MTTKLNLIVPGVVIGSFLTLPAVAQQDRPDLADQTAGLAEAGFEDIDTDLDGSISRAELGAVAGDQDLDQLFSALDADGDGVISRAEWTSWQSQQAEAAAGPRHRVELAITDDTFEGRYFTDGGLVGLGGSSLVLGLLFSTDRDLVGQGQLMMPGLLRGWGPDFLTLSLGVKAHLGLLADPDEEVFDLAPGAEARIALPFDTPMAVVASVFYAPDILTFGDADSALDFNLRYEVQFLEHATGFVGYRLLEFDRDGGGDDDIVDSFQFGLRFAF